MNRSLYKSFIPFATGILIFAMQGASVKAALLAYEPFTNSVGANIIGSSNGFGFNGTWQANSSSGVATNTAFGLSYTDTTSNTLVTIGGAGFFQGLTSANSDMKPIRLFNVGRGTNGTDGVTTWISFLIARQGPTGTLPGNPYGRGANLPHDIDSGAIQKLAIGNSSNAGSNTVGLIPTGNGANLKGSTNTFGGVTNFVVVRIDHVAGVANDRAYLFVNPTLGVEPSTNSPSAVSSNAFDFSFDRLRIFAGGQSSATQPYAELIVDEYRLGETYADVMPMVGNTASNVAWGPIVITNVYLIPGGVVVSGKGGSNGATYFVLSTNSLNAPLTNWPAVATNFFAANGDFSASISTAGASLRFYRLFVGNLPSVPVVPPSITTQPTNQTSLTGQNVTFVVAASGDAPLRYQWRFNTNAPVSNATNATLTLTNLQFASAGAYSVVITNAGGSVTSDVVTLIINGPPLISTQPTNSTVLAGNTATFVVAASGSPTLKYQWYFNTNTPLANATNTSLIVTNVQATNAGAYMVIVTNSYGSATSSVATLTIGAPLVAGAFFVSPSGSDANPGSLASPYLTITKGLNAITTGGVVYLRGGTYAQSAKLSLTRTTATATNMFRLWSYPGEVPVVDATGNSSDCFSISGRYYHLKGITVRLAGHNGVNISGHSNIVENCVTYSNGNTGVHITGSQSGTTFPSYNLILNCDSYLNYDPPAGGNADGFSAKWDMGPGNVFRGCRAWWNSDDGWDLWMANSLIVIEGCWAFSNGTNYWGNPSFNGNGNGFKLGGNSIGTPHLVRNCVAFDNTKFGPNGAGRGFDENNNLSGQTIYNCIAYRNTGNNYHFQNTVTNGQHIFRNCISYVGNVNITSGVSDHNSWNGFTVSAADFQSLDASQAMVTRNADGTLPATTLFRLNTGSSMMDAGVDVGLPYNGSAPDLGAFEDGL